MAGMAVLVLDAVQKSSQGGGEISEWEAPCAAFVSWRHPPACPGVGMERRDLVGREPYAALLFVLETSPAAAVASLLLLTEEVDYFPPW